MKIKTKKTKGFEFVPKTKNVTVFKIECRLIGIGWIVICRDKKGFHRLRGIEEAHKMQDIREFETVEKACRFFADRATDLVKDEREIESVTIQTVRKQVPIG